jgi:hypothetical protein
MTVSVAVMVVLLMSLFSVIPAFAQPENLHCVGRVYPAEMNRQGEHLACFNNVRAALSFATNGNVLVPFNATQRQVDMALRAFEAQTATVSAEGDVISLATHVVAIQWDWTK